MRCPSYRLMVSEQTVEAGRRNGIDAEQGTPHDLARSDSGIATLEFALILPVMMMLIYGVGEYVNAADHRSKVSSLARTLADLTAQTRTKQLSPEEMSGNMGAAKSILEPFDSSQATIQISAIGVNANKAAFICSTYRKSATPQSGSNNSQPQTLPARTVGKDGSLDVPKNFQRSGARYILAEVQMKYEPLFKTVLNPLFEKAELFNWSEKVAWPVRGGESGGAGLDAEIIMPNGAACNPKLT